nr:uncharacterized protein LOC103347245 isoform X6 [Oryctolagus cuniculus]
MYWKDSVTESDAWKGCPLQIVTRPRRGWPGLHQRLASRGPSPSLGLGGAAAQVRPCWSRVHHTSSAAGRDAKNTAAAMAMAMMAGNAAYFQRGSLFWFAVIMLSLGYCTWLSSGRRASLMRALGSWARSLSPWWTIITPSCTTVVVLWPQSIPYESLGLLGSFTQSLVDHHHTLLHNSGLSSGHTASLMRALGSWARSLSPWWTIITPSCTTGKVTCKNNTLVSLETLKACSCL